MEQVYTFENWRKWVEGVAKVGGWTLAPEDESRSHYVHAEDSTGAKFYLALNGMKGKVHIAGNYPMDNGGYQSARDWGAIGWNDSPPECSVAIGREAGAAARDIERRFLVPYRAVYAKCLEKQAERIAERNSRQNFAAQVREKLGERARPSYKAGNPDPESVQIHSDKAGWGSFDQDRIDLHSVPAGLMLEIAGLVGSWQG